VPDYNALWTSAKAIYKPYSEAASFISSTGFFIYLLKEGIKYFKKPKLDFGLIPTLRTINVIDSNQGTRSVRRDHVAGTCEIIQHYEFSIVNSSESIAFKLRFKYESQFLELIEWKPSPNNIAPLTANQRITFNIIFTKPVFGSVDEMMKIPVEFPATEIRVEFQNSKGTKFTNLIYPNKLLTE